MKLTRLQNEGHVLHILKVTLSCLICFVITACSPSNPQRTRNEITGPQEERVTRATSILAKYGQLPGPLLDAHGRGHSQQQWRDGSWSVRIVAFWCDPHLFCWRTKVARGIVSGDQSSAVTGIHQSNCSPSWWPTAGAFESCEFYSPKKLTGRSGGFVALSPSASAIYFSTTKIWFGTVLIS